MGKLFSWSTIFADGGLSAKTTKIMRLKNLGLYGILRSLALVQADCAEEEKNSLVLTVCAYAVIPTICGNYNITAFLHVTQFMYACASILSTPAIQWS